MELSSSYDIVLTYGIDLSDMAVAEELQHLRNSLPDCRGDFWISSYWLALTRNLRSPPIFYFSEEKGESSKKPYFWEIKGPGVGYAKGRY